MVRCLLKLVKYGSTTPIALTVKMPNSAPRRRPSNWLNATAAAAHSSSSSTPAVKPSMDGFPSRALIAHRRVDGGKRQLHVRHAVRRARGMMQAQRAGGGEALRSQSAGLKLPGPTRR